MPFGLKNAPTIFQGAMDVILATVKWQHALVYIDDITIFSPTPEDHTDHVESLLGLIKRAGMTLKLKKCYFFSEAIDYLGRVITSGCLYVASKAKETVRRLKYATKTTELGSFLDLCNVYRRFVWNFARKAAPLNQMLRKGEPTKFDLDDIGKAAVDELKEILTNRAILVLPQEDKPFVIEIDSCDKQVRCVLLQSQNSLKDLRPAGYWSRTLNDPERKYETTQQKFLAVVWAVLLLRPYVEES